MANFQFQSKACLRLCESYNDSCSGLNFDYCSNLDWAFCNPPVSSSLLCRAGLLSVSCNWQRLWKKHSICQATSLPFRRFVTEAWQGSRLEATQNSRASSWKTRFPLAAQGCFAQTPPLIHNSLAGLLIVGRFGSSFFPLLKSVAEAS